MSVIIFRVDVIGPNQKTPVFVIEHYQKKTHCKKQQNPLKILLFSFEQRTMK